MSSYRKKPPQPRPARPPEWQEQLAQQSGESNL